MTNKEQPESFIDLELLKPYTDIEFGLESAIVRTKNSDLIAHHRTYLQIYHELKNKLESTGYRVISIRDNALLRLFSGIDSFVSRNSNWARESILVLPNQEFYLTLENPLIEYPNKTELEKIISKSIKIEPNWGKPWENYRSYSVPSNRLDEDPLTASFLQDMAKPYGQFLLNNGFKEFSISLIRRDLQYPQIFPVSFHGFRKSSSSPQQKFCKTDSDMDTNGTAYTLRGVRGKTWDKDNFKEFARYLGFVHEKDVQTSLEKAISALNTIKLL